MTALGAGDAVGSPVLAFLLTCCVSSSRFLNTLNPILTTVIIIVRSGGLSLEQGGLCKAY